ncbi:MAG: hypothetical protein U1E89_21445 [Burkholderiaceae bacterium]
MGFAIRSAGAAALLGIVSLLGACGGGGSDAPKQPAVPEVFPSRGDATRYAGSWRSGCGSLMVNGTELHGVQFELAFQTTSGNVATGTLTTWDFGKNNVSCTGSSSVSSVSATATIDTIPIAVRGSVTGLADIVTLAPQGGGGGQTIYIGFAADYKSFQLSSGSTFSITNLTYTRTTP